MPKTNRQTALRSARFRSAKTDRKAAPPAPKINEGKDELLAYSVAEAARRVSLSRSFLWERIGYYREERRGGLTPTTKGHRTVVRHVDLEAWLAEDEKSGRGGNNRAGGVDDTGEDPQ